MKTRPVEHSPCSSLCAVVCCFVLSALAGTAWSQAVKEVPLSTLKAKLIGHWQCTPDDIQCMDDSTPELEHLQHVLFTFSFSADGTFTQWLHGTDGQVSGYAGKWSIQERGSRDGRWHLLQLRPSREWAYPATDSSALKPSGTKIYMTTASTDAFSTIIDHAGEDGDCCTGDRSHMLNTFFRMSAFDAGFPSAAASFRTVAELKQKLTQAIATPDSDKRWEKWLACFPSQPGGDGVGWPKCLKEWKAFAAAYDSPEVDEISSLEIARVHVPYFIAELKLAFGPKIANAEAAKIRAAEGKALNAKGNSFRSARYWGLISITTGNATLAVPVGITPNNRYIGLFLNR